jgi:integrase
MAPANARWQRRLALVGVALAAIISLFLLGLNYRAGAAFVVGTATAGALIQGFRARAGSAGLLALLALLVLAVLIRSNAATKNSTALVPWVPSVVSIVPSEQVPADSLALLELSGGNGGRSAEVLGLEVEDISFDREIVTYRINEWRRLKTLKAARVVPLMPQLAEILRPYIFSRPATRLLFPSFLTGGEAMITDWRKTLDRIAIRAGWKRGEIRTRRFRHTYCAARLQTLDGGAPISPFTVSRELGHGSGAMVEEIYSHLGTVRHRADEVEFRIEQHRATLADRLPFPGLVPEFVPSVTNARQQAQA